MSRNPLKEFNNAVEKLSDGAGDDVMQLLNDIPADQLQHRLADGFATNDEGNAERLKKAADGKARFVLDWDEWVVYRNGRWFVEGSDWPGLMRFFFDNASKMREEAKGLKGYRSEELWAHAERCGSVRVARNAIIALKADSSIHIHHSEFDADPWLLNVRNGTVDLRTGELREHNPNDLLMHQASVDYDPDAEAPTWLRCLEEWQPDPEVREFLQTILGSAVTGFPVQYLFVNVGGGANGKSQFFGAITRLLGEYAKSPNKSVFVTQKNESHPTHLADLFRARLVLSPETESGDKLAEAQIKSITGGDKISARRMRQDLWEYDPTHTLFMHTNYTPRVRGDDEGIWRRIMMIPWSVTIDRDKRDPTLADKLDAERSGILNWLIEGALKFHSNNRRIDPPKQIAKATEDYRAEEDHVGRFISECLVEDSNASIPAGVLRTHYESWCEDNGEFRWTAKALGANLTGRGFERFKSGGVQKWKGIGLPGKEKKQSAGIEI